MAEVVTLQLGQCGNKMGAKFWMSVAAEHCLDLDGKLNSKFTKPGEQIDSFFKIKENRIQYVPRAIFVDPSPSRMNEIMFDSRNSVIREVPVITGSEETSNNFAKGYYHTGSKMLKNVKEAIAREVEACDSVRTFNILHAIGGGSGSSLSALVAADLKDQYKKVLLNSFTIFPSTKFSEKPIEPYNSGFAVKHLSQMFDQTFLMDNEGLCNVCLNTMAISEVINYGDINAVIARIITDITAPMRFCYPLDASFNKIHVNLSTENNYNILVPSIIPSPSQDKLSINNISQKDIGEAVLNVDNYAASFPKTNDLKFRSVGIFLRGYSSFESAMKYIKYFTENTSLTMCEEEKISCLTSLCEVAPTDSRTSVTLVSKLVNIAQIIRRILDAFIKMYKSKAYVHIYQADGLEDEEFKETMSVLSQLACFLDDSLANDPNILGLN